MRKLSFFLTFAMVLGLASGAFAQAHNGIVSIVSVTNTYDHLGVIKLRAGQSHMVSINYNFLANANPAPWGATNAWELYSPTAQTG